MSAREPDSSILIQLSQEQGSLAQRSLTLDPLWYLVVFLFLSGVGMIGAALVDVALMVSVMSAGLSDAFGRTTEPVSLWFGSGVMLICYWGIGVLYAKDGLPRKVSYLAYGAMVLIIGCLLFPVQSAKFAEIWSSVSGSDPFGATQNTSNPPQALLLFLVGINALLYTGPGLFFIWTKGRFTHWIERCRNRSQAKKQGRMADEAAKENETKHQCALILESLTPESLGQIVSASMRHGHGVYASLIETKASTAKLLRADVSSSKAEKHQAEIDHGQAVMCRSSLQNVTL